MSKKSNYKNLTEIDENILLVFESRVLSDNKINT